MNGDGGTIRGVGLKRQLDVRLDGARIKLFTVGGEHYGKSRERELWAVLREIPNKKNTNATGRMQAWRCAFPAKAGPHVVGVAFLVEDASEPEGVISWKTTLPRTGKEKEMPNLGGERHDQRALRRKRIGETPSRRKIFVCHPAGGEKAAARSNWRRSRLAMTKRLAPGRFSPRWRIALIAGLSPMKTSRLCSASTRPVGARGL